MTNPKLSIIVPCFNVEEYLRESLDGLTGQTLEEVEIICVNDGSTDGTLQVLEEYRERFSDRFVIIDKENEGVWKARISGVRAARGEYIGFADPDDQVDIDFARMMWKRAVDTDADIVCCGFQRMDDEFVRTYSTEMTDFPVDEIPLKRDPGLLLEVNTALWNKIFKAQIIKKLPEFRNVPRAFSDMIYLNLIYMKAGKMTFVKESLVRYRVRSGSIISSVGKDLVPEIYSSMKELRQVNSRNRNDMLEYTDACALLHLGISLMYRLSGEGREEFKEILKDNRNFLDEEFPMWNSSPYISLWYVLTHKGANKKLMLVSRIYRTGLYGAFLKIYRFVINTFKTDIKW